VSDQRNTVVRLALEVQELLDQLNAGDDVRAALTAEQVAAHAADVARELAPSETARP
jgi:hypothetical protein